VTRNSSEVGWLFPTKQEQKPTVQEGKGVRKERGSLKERDTRLLHQCGGWSSALETVSGKPQT